MLDRRFFGSTGRVQVGANGGAVDEDFLQIGVTADRLQQPRPYPGLVPARKAGVGALEGGSMIDEVTIIPGGDDDDDWLQFDLRSADPAIAAFVRSDCV